MQICLKSTFRLWCGKSVNLANNDTNGVSEQGASTSRIEGDGHNSPVSSTSSWITSTNTRPVTFTEFCSHKESHRRKHRS